MEQTMSIEKIIKNNGGELYFSFIEPAGMSHQERPWKVYLSKGGVTGRHYVNIWHKDRGEEVVEKFYVHDKWMGKFKVPEPVAEAVDRLLATLI